MTSDFRLFCLICLTTALTAAEARFSLALDHQPAQTALALAGRLGAGEQHREIAELAAGVPAIDVYLADASLAGLRQALAHAQGCWWLPEAGATRYSRAASPPLGGLEARAYTSGLVNQPGLETQVRTLLAPWLADPTCGVAYLPSEGLWTATLDQAGHARLLEALTMLERAPAQCPPLFADVDLPRPDLRLDRPLLAASWSDLAGKLSSALPLSVSCGDDLPAAPPTLALRPGTLDEVSSQLMALGIRPALLHGVLCLGGEQPRERQHPALRRRLAHLPVGHLLTSDAEGQLLASLIRARIAPWWWNLSGAALFYRADHRALVVAADPATLHQVADQLDRADLLGFDRAFSESEH